MIAILGRFGLGAMIGFAIADSIDKHTFVYLPILALGCYLMWQDIVANKLFKEN